MIRLKTWYHGPFSEMAGREQEENTFPGRLTLSDLFEALAVRYGKGFREMLSGYETESVLHGVQVLVNNRLLPMDTELKDGDEVAFVMALAGG